MRVSGLCWVLGATTAIITAPAVAASDNLCNQLKAFEAAPLPVGKDGEPVRRWVEFHWPGPKTGVIWGAQCQHTPDPSARALCAYLIDNTSTEFSRSLPISILGCFGYRFPRFAQYDWSAWASTVDLHGERDPADGHKLMLDVGPTKDGDWAARISEIPDDPGRDDVDPGPLIDRPAAKFNDAPG